LVKVYVNLGRAAEAEAIYKRMYELTDGPDGPVYGGDIICDACGGVLQGGEYYYHCNICNNANFDLCRNCMSGGASCLEEAHHIIKRRLPDRLLGF
jgi:hypothetical protein